MFDSYLIYKCDIIEYSDDGYGRRTEIGRQSGVRCFVRFANRILHDEHGQRTSVDARFYFSPKTVVKPGFKIEYKGQTYSVEYIDNNDTFSGTSAGITALVGRIGGG